MFKHMIIGQYVEGRSYIHSLDPRAKLISLFLLMIIIFTANNWLSYAVVVSFALICILISRVSFTYIYKGLRPILLLVFFTFLLHVFLTREGEILAQWGIFTIYEGGIIRGAFISIRLLSLVVLASLLTLTTSPIALTDGIETLLSPLKRFGLPAHELALMMSIALRFIPTLIQETEKIMKAQMARGLDITSGPLKERVKAIVPLFIPLFISAFKRAEDLAFAMEARGYRGGEGRTKLRSLHWRVKDTVALIIIILLGVCIFFLR
ncbi:MAG TPA: energy-coupling factor transporter transmembrane protein EcfT [Bacilli bacterium]|nr:energy-coupling factor transporter transmembrane protein EcfT [Bacilli bacterium]